MSSCLIMATTTMAARIERMNKSRFRIAQNAWGNWYGYEGRNRVQAFGESSEWTAEQAASDWLLDRQHEERVARFVPGVVVRVTDAARVDMVGKVYAVCPNGRVEVKVPGWQADGYHLMTVVHVNDLELVPASELARTVKARGW